MLFDEKVLTLNLQFKNSNENMRADEQLSYKSDDIPTY